MKRLSLGLVVLSFFLLLEVTRADSIWERRNPRFAALYDDIRARHVGDVLTIEVKENTSFRGQERRDLNKETIDSGNFTMSGQSTSGTAGTRSFAAFLKGQGDSRRRLDSRANTQIQRVFLDGMSVIVIDVWPNGNLVVEGYRTRVVARERRMMRVVGIVRTVDIGPGNRIQSDYIANMELTYIGRGQESAYQDNGWMGKLWNVVWPW